MITILFSFLLVIFLPGLIWAYLDTKYGQYREVKRHILFFNAVLFGFFNYVLLGVIYALCGQQISFLEISSTEDKLNPTLFHDEIIAAIFSGLFFSGVWLRGVRKKWLNRLLTYCGLTERFDEKDVFNFMLNSEIPEFQYAHIWDTERKIKFIGFIRSFSDKGDVREILLQHAEAYDFDGGLFSIAKYMYVTCPKNKLWMEFPERPSVNNEI